VNTPMPSYKGHRYPIEIINQCVWLYFRFPLSFREIEEMMLERGVVVGYETIRRWCAKFGQAYANQLRRRRQRPGDKWHMDEVFIQITGTQHYLWRAVDQHGNVLDALVQSRRNALAAHRFFCRLLKGLEHVPRVIITDKLGSYQVAHRELLGSVEHRRSKYLNNRAENSHQPTRQRERAMKRFKSPGHTQRFLSAVSGISPHFRPQRNSIANCPKTTVPLHFSISVTVPPGESPWCPVLVAGPSDVPASSRYTGSRQGETSSLASPATRAPHGLPLTTARMRGWSVAPAGIVTATST
jgi:putative transposase